MHIAEEPQLHHTTCARSTSTALQRLQPLPHETITSRPKACVAGPPVWQTWDNTCPERQTHKETQACKSQNEPQLHRTTCARAVLRQSGHGSAAASGLSLACADSHNRSHT